VPAQFDLKAMAPERTVFLGKVRSLVAPGREGYLGVLARHAPMVVELATGRVQVEEEGGRVRFFALSGGFLEVGGNQATILADVMESAEEIDVARAQAAQRRAQDRLALRAPGVDLARAQAALQRALNRLRVAQARR
jgi:F-type H+-transporting ATPase subunit epsilon